MRSHKFQSNIKFINYLRRNIIKYIVTILCLTNVHFLWKLQDRTPIRLFHYNVRLINGIICYNHLNTDDRYSLDDISSTKNIFFLESSCRGNLDSRQACAIESAARIHPEWKIYLLLANSMDKLSLKGGTLHQLSKFENVFFKRFRPSKLVKETPWSKFNNFLASLKRSSDESIPKAEDVVKYIVLYKYGGVYINFDGIVVNPLDSFGENWALTHGKWIDANVVGIAKNELGRNLSSVILREILKTKSKENYDQTGILLQSFDRFCTAEKLTDISTSTCNGFKVINMSDFSNIHFTRQTPSADSSSVTEESLEASVLKYRREPVDSETRKVAKKYCPVIYEMYEDEFEDDLPVLKDADVKSGKTIFFLETTCRGNINVRQACTIESAAKNNPNWDVIVLFAGPVSKGYQMIGPLADLNSYVNIKFYRIHMRDFALVTPLEAVFKSNFSDGRPYPVTHLSDLLRFVVLYKYGGTYLDLDFIVIKSFDTLPPNWVGKETYDELAVGAQAMANDRVGKKLALTTAWALAMAYDPYAWNSGTVLGLHTGLRAVCSVSNISLMNAGNCNGVFLYESQFYPIHYSEWHLYFVEHNESRPFLEDEIYAHHLWNTYSHRAKIAEKSWYAILAEMQCPVIYHKYRKKFGQKGTVAHFWIV